MKKLPILLLLTAIYGFSCSNSINKIFGKERTPHEEYEEKLDDRGLDKTPEGRQWLAASVAAIENPHTIKLPYRQHGFFPVDKPRALGLAFSAKRGEKLIFELDKKPAAPITLYADLFRQDGLEPAHLLAADTTASRFSFDIEENGIYILRLQPELFRSGEYSLSISLGPSLEFPVSGSKARTGSFWGDSRDGGKRSHEGIDIFAPKRTPAVAAADGYITGVREGGIGGKTVWLRPVDRNISLYYAHLDKQLVSEGQFVKKGEVVGLVGNTGNAKHTPAHLHFGIYGYGGAVDPLPFVNKTVKTAPAVAAKKLTDYLKLVKSIKTSLGQTIAVNTLLVPLGVNASGYLAELPDGRITQTSFASVKTVKAETPIQSVATQAANSQPRS